MNRAHVLKHETWRESISVPEDTLLFWRFGTTGLYIRKSGEVCNILTEQDPGGKPAWQFAKPISKGREKSPEGKWESYFVGSMETIKIVPIVPDRPLVLKPSNAVKLLPGRAVTFYFGIPLWIRVITERGNVSTTIRDVPLNTFSQIWFGDPLGGELCYSLDISLFTQSEQIDLTPCTSLCKVRIKNGSASLLDLQKICLHTEYYTIFERKGVLWTDELIYQFRGEEQSSQINYTRKPPKESGGAKLLTAPRVLPTQNIIKRSFGLLKDFAG